VKPHELILAEMAVPRALKILMIAPQFRPLIGGYERAAERLSSALAARGHAVTVVTEQRSRSWAAAEEIQGFQLRRLPCVYRRGWHLRTSLASFGAYLLARGLDFDVWHVHQYGMHAVLASMLGKVMGRPVVLKLTASRDQGISAVFGTSRLSRVLAAMLRRVDAVVALSRETRDEALDFGIPGTRVHLIGNGVDTQAFTPRSADERRQIRLSLGIDAGGVVLCVARHDRQKNLEGLLDAWKLAHDQVPVDWKLVLIGDGILGSSIEQRVRSEGLESRVVMLAAQPSDRWMAAADIYALASNWEGLSNTTLEAMASGVPVVSTRVSGAAETLGETGAGLICDVGRMDLFAENLKRLVKEQRLRSVMGATGRRIIESQYAIESIAEQHETLYCTLMRKSA
jgi:glycosyltransferase involved in cell wall biosynthesis